MYQCEFWDCTDVAADSKPLCMDHESQLHDREINECPSCELFKEAEFALCGDCESISSYENLLDFDTSPDPLGDVELYSDEAW
jgi:hypothetical protein